MSDSKTIVVIGAGVAGVSCLQSLFLDYDAANANYNKVILLSNTRIVKKIFDFRSTGRQLESFDVLESDNLDDLYSLVPEGLEFQFVMGFVQHIDSSNKTVLFIRGDDDQEGNLPYDILCLCNGSKPRKLIENIRPEIDSKVIVIRDTDTVKDLQDKLSQCQRLVIVGNGGISLELVAKVTNCEKIWVVRDDYIGCTFFDSGAAKFLLDAFTSKTHDPDLSSQKPKTNPFHSASDKIQNVEIDRFYGPALGPKWSENFELKGKCSGVKLVDIIYNDDVIDIRLDSNKVENQVKVITRNGSEIDCDLVVSAIGVIPNNLEVYGSNDLKKSCTDNGILVDSQMRTSVKDVYAAGDVASCDNWTHSKLWFQMRLWTQARQMGYYAGKCIAAHLADQDPSIYFNFDCFTHCTSFFGYKLVLLGRYNAQGVTKHENMQVIVRVIPSKEYVKVLIDADGRIVGAVLVGDSGLEETVENLMHDGIDISHIKDQLLDDTVDIEDYFD